MSLWCLSYNTTLWADDICGSQSWYALYECRVENICSSYKSEKPVYTPEDYDEAQWVNPEYQNQQDATAALTQAKKIYRENMESIYKCAIIQTQKNTLNMLGDTLNQESTWQLRDVIWWQIDTRVNRLDVANNAVGCAQTDDESIQNKLNILNETTYEMCRYTSYLSYLEAYYEDISHSLEIDDETSYPFWQVPQILGKTTSEISQEIDHTYEVFPIAYRAYSEYENNFALHFLLEVIRGDFLVLRQQLYATLMPIAQLGIKVINAMSY